jgi:hypothetical protein
MLHQELYRRQATTPSCHAENSSTTLLRGLIHIRSCPNQTLNFGHVTPTSCKMERTFDDLPLRIHGAAVDFVSRPIASLTICVAICCVLTSAAILHRGCTRMVTAIAGSRHVLKLDNHPTADIRSGNLLVNLQLNSKSSVFVGGISFNASKLPVVCCIVEALKAYEVAELESDHYNRI